MPLRPTENGISAVTRNNAHFYFAADAEILTPLMKDYEGPAPDDSFVES